MPDLTVDTKGDDDGVNNERRPTCMEDLLLNDPADESAKAGRIS